MESEKISAERWPRTFRDLMAKTRADVKRSRFVSSEQRRAGIPDEEYLEDAEGELKSVIQALETVGESSDRGADIDFDELQYAVKNLNYALSSLSNVMGHENAIRAVQDVDEMLSKLVREVHNEYKEWDRENSRHQIKNMGLGRDAQGIAKKTKAIRIEAQR